MNSIEKIFSKRVLNSQFNTSYPINPNDWIKYRSSECLSFDEVNELSFYIHIPFCQELCDFCEYTRVRCPNEITQLEYLNILKSDVDNFTKKHTDIVLSGFDLGGGTPTALSERNFESLIEIYRETLTKVSVNEDFEPSIEGTFQTLTEFKIQKICQSGIKRISLGLQSTQSNVLSVNKRIKTEVQEASNWIKYAKSKGIDKINLDFMYGLKRQTTSDIYSDIETIAYLEPEQVTLYELRTNMLKYSNIIDKDFSFQFYKTIYDELIKLGYKAHFGQNTFSKNVSDFGVSSYLKNRMLYGKPYKGFGISAQSMNINGISYNIGKNYKDLTNVINSDNYTEEYTYNLPKQELLSKYIAVSGYYGRFSLITATEILGIDSKQYFDKEIGFCLDNNLLTLDNDFLHITQTGFRNYGAVFSLFYKKTAL
jgi:oxygen-independent coproporphyrinogen-3 oxidase